MGDSEADAKRYGPLDEDLKGGELYYITEARERAAKGEDRPAEDLGYCACGTIWNLVALAVYDGCPDCGAKPVFIERKQ